VKRFIMIVIMLMAVSIVSAQDTRYVTDELSFALRTGKSTQHKIIRMLPSGLSVTVLEDFDDGYSHIVTAEGVEGWILSRYLTIDPSAREQLETLRLAHERVSAASEELNSRFASTDASRKQLETQNRDLQAQIGMLRKELSDLRRTAARPMELSRENAALQRQFDQQQGEIHQLRFDNKLLRDQSKRNWFLAGTGVTLGSLFLGLVIPRIPWRKRRGWSEL
jgi:SH3 domain protein